MGTNWEQLINEVDLKIVPTFLIQEIHFIHPGSPDVIMRLDQLDSHTVDLLGDTIRNLSADSNNRIRVVIDVNKLQAHIEPFVGRVLQSLS